MICMNYDHNKKFGLLKFHSGYVKFYFNSPGYNRKIINAQTDSHVHINCQCRRYMVVMSKPCNFNIYRKWLFDSTQNSCVHCFKILYSWANQNTFKKHCLEVKILYTTDIIMMFWETRNSTSRFWQFILKI